MFFVILCCSCEDYLYQNSRVAVRQNHFSYYSLIHFSFPLAPSLSMSKKPIYFVSRVAL